MDAIEIKKWIQDPKKKFEDGLKLFDKYKRSNAYDKFFRTAPTFSQGSIQFNLLVNELTNIFRIQIANSQVIAEKASSSEAKPIIVTAVKSVVEKRATSLKIIDHELTVEYSKLPEELKVKFNKIKELSRSLGGLKSMLDDPKTSKDQRQKIANAICTQWDERRELWSELDAWAKALPGKNEKSPEEIKKEIKKYRDYINRALSAKTSKNATKTETKVAAWGSEIAKLELSLQNAKP